MENPQRMQLFAGNSNPELAQEISEYLDLPLSNAHVSRFPDGEIDIKISDDVRGVDAFVIQSTCPPVNENLMELLLMVDCLKRASADRITAVIPYFGYARKDRKDEGRVPITAKLVANLLTSAGVNRILAMDLHATQIQGFFDIPVDHLFASPVMTDYFRRLELTDLTVVSPDVGAIKIARGYSKRLRGELAIVDKRRIGPTQTEMVNVIGDVEGKNVIMIDDMIATGGTIANAAGIVKKLGAKKVYICATHPVFAGDAMKKLESAPVEKVLVSNSIPLKVNGSAKIEVLSVAPLLGEVIKRIHENQSVSSLFS